MSCGCNCFFVPPYIEDMISNPESKLQSNLLRKIRALNHEASSLYENAQHPDFTKNEDNFVVEHKDCQDLYDANFRMNFPGQKIASTSIEADSIEGYARECFLCTEKCIFFLLNYLDYDIASKMGGQVISTVNAAVKLNNAFYTGSQFVYGRGDGINFQDLGSDITVVGHEMAHAIVRQTSGLVYQGDSGAIDEHFADVIGVVLKQYNDMPRSQDFPSREFWLVGGDCIVYPGEGLRSFTSESAGRFDNNPKHMRDKYTGPGDNGGVHINSSILNHAFYLVAQYVGGRTWNKLLKVWFAAMQSKKLKPDAKFITFAFYIYWHAYKLYGYETAMGFYQGFKDVGMYDPPAQSLRSDQESFTAKDLEHYAQGRIYESPFEA